MSTVAGPKYVIVRFTEDAQPFGVKGELRKYSEVEARALTHPRDGGMPFAEIVGAPTPRDKSRDIGRAGHVFERPADSETSALRAMVAELSAQVAALSAAKGKAAKGDA